MHRFHDKRVAPVLERLADCGLRRFALTGGLAIGIALGESHRALNDVDLVVPSFADLPATLAGRYLFRHIHPKAGNGKTLVQIVDPDHAVRIDIFGEQGATVRRSRPFCIGSLFPLVACREDLAARLARVLLELDAGLPVHSKHADDFLRLADLLDPYRAEEAWLDHRKPSHPHTFHETSELLRALIAGSPHLLTTAVYSRDTQAMCGRCEAIGPFHLAPAAEILAILGYC